MGLFETLVGNRSDSLAMHGAFRQSLCWMETLDPNRAMLEDWTKEHFIMGMIRLLDQCIQYKAGLLPLSLTKEINNKISKLREVAWTYMQENK